MPTHTPYPPIHEYALIGDCHSAALVSRSGSIDWCCVPRFDSGSCFGRILDWEHGGFCSIFPDDGAHTSFRAISRRHTRPGDDLHGGQRRSDPLRLLHDDGGREAGPAPPVAAHRRGRAGPRHLPPARRGALRLRRAQAVDPARGRPALQRDRRQRRPRYPVRRRTRARGPARSARHLLRPGRGADTHLDGL